MADPILPDPLLILRHSLSLSLPISLLSSTGSIAPSLLSSTHISFPSLPLSPSFPKFLPTRFFAGPSPDHSNPSSQPTYDLQTLLFGWQQREVQTGEYVKNARGEGVGFVSATDRRLVIAYLGGKGPAEEGEGTRVRAMSEEEREATRKVLPGLGGTVDGEKETMATKRDATGDQVGTKQGGVPGAEGKLQQQQPPTKKPRYAADKGDQEKVKRMGLIMDGPQFGHVVAPNETKDKETTGQKVDRTGGAGGAAFHSRETVLRGERYNNFDSVRSLISPRLELLQSVSNGSTSSSSKPSSSSTPGALKPIQSTSSKKKQLNPIIMISPSSTALITMHNVKDFLQDSRFVPSDQAKLLATQGMSSGYLAEDVVQVNHARATGGAGGGKGAVETRMARYFVVDSVDALEKLAGQGKGQEAWDRVVCVMTTGQEWQFKSYKWQEPKQLFHNVKGVYPQWSTDPLNPKIKAWNVSELRIDPHKRHIDKSVVADFWRGLEQWIGDNKPWLSY
ncbi:Cdc73p [Sporobolomyces salmoneus]|uniref:Cdc73p n=1 Tax=Sporobolomyces salmoneus TaxID=183962 RepID=UPI00317C3794